MLIAASEGRHWRYEVCEHSDGYLVQMRDLQTGALQEDFATVFRTVLVAFAYAEMSAAMDRFASAELEATEEAGPIDLEASEQRFITLSRSLQDSGMDFSALSAWERRTVSPRRTLH